MANPYENAARERKAFALADALDAMRHSVDAAERMAPEEREVVARAIGVKPPSEETWTRACQLLESRYSLRFRVQSDDPFKGLTP